MTAPRDPGPAEAETGALLELLGRARRALARGGEGGFGRLLPLLTRLAGAPATAPERDRRGARRALLSLLDDAGQLAAQIRQVQARLATQLRATGVHRRAGVAYRRASKL